MLDSVVITARPRKNFEPNVRHIVFKGLSRWIIDRNKTSKCYIIRSSDSFIQLPKNVQISIENAEYHSYVHPCARNFVQVAKPSSYC